MVSLSYDNCNPQYVLRVGGYLNNFSNNFSQKILFKLVFADTPGFLFSDLFYSEIHYGITQYAYPLLNRK